jgi:predicted DNA-binding mobile mystery protein A
MYPGRNHNAYGNHMKDKDFLKLEQLESLLRPYQRLIGLKPPRLGWVRAIRETLGMTNIQLAKRIGVTASQSVEDMQEYEVAGTIKLQTLRKLADALECQLVYALVPRKPLHDIRRDRASIVAQRLLKRVSHSMSLEDQAVSSEEEKNEQERRIDKLLAGNPKKLWD